MIIDNDLKNIPSHKATGLDSFTVRILSYFERKKSGSGEGRSRRSIPPSVLLTAALAFSPKENDSLVCGNHLDNTDFPAETPIVILLRLPSNRGQPSYRRLGQQTSAR